MLIKPRVRGYPGRRGPNKWWWVREHLVAGTIFSERSSKPRNLATRKPGKLTGHTFLRDKTGPFPKWNGATDTKLTFENSAKLGVMAPNALSVVISWAWFIATAGRFVATDNDELNGGWEWSLFDNGGSQYFGFNIFGVGQRLSSAWTPDWGDSQFHDYALMFNQDKNSIQAYREDVRQLNTTFLGAIAGGGTTNPLTIGSRASTDLAITAAPKYVYVFDTDIPAKWYYELRRAPFDWLRDVDDAPLIITPASGVTINPPLGTYTLTGLAPVVGAGASAAPPVQAFTLTGFPPTLVVGGVVIAVPLGTFLRNSFPPIVGAGASMDVPLQPFTLTGFAPTIVASDPSAADWQNVGLLVEDDATQIYTRSRHNVGDTAAGAATWTPNSQPGADAALNAAARIQVGPTTADNVTGVNETGLPINTRHEPTLLMNRVSLTGIMRFLHGAGAADGHWDIDISKLKTGWNMVNRDHPAVTVVNEWESTAGGALQPRFDSVADTIICDIDHLTFVQGTVGRHPIPSNGSTVALAAEAIADGVEGYWENDLTITWEIWPLYPNANHTGRRYIQHSRDATPTLEFELFISPTTGTCRAIYGGGDVETVNAVNPNEKNTVTVTFGGGALSIKLNTGAEVKDTGLTLPTAKPADANSKIGSHHVNGLQFNGFLTRRTVA